MARPPLPIGSWGEISTWVTQTDDEGNPTKYKSQARYRDHDGHVRPVSAYGKTKATSRQAVLKKLQDRAKTGHGGDLTAMHKINHLLDLWEEKFKEQIADGTRSPTSLDTYLRAIKNHVRPALGELRIGEVSTPRVDTVISEIKKNTGPPTARTCRAVISGMMQLAVRYGAITGNPVREVESIEHPAKKPARAISADEITLLRAHLKADPTAVRADLPDLVTFMLGTGARIGESLAVLWSQIDLDTATVDITHTIARIKGEGPGRSPASSPVLVSPGVLQSSGTGSVGVAIHRSDPPTAMASGATRPMPLIRSAPARATLPITG
ncbi:hypothetical protein GCM10009789_65730 [Kribbella sancticallisti]|uniref:Phage integrase central domain-containing protein n=1 Tax=Kribbella sancticallisti TaxID=460087 RepID=A0ABN2EC10_9ACTN